MANKMSFNYVKKGYSPFEVDEYIETIENILKSYKEKDSAIKNALINAQIAADNIIKNAELEADHVKKQAEKYLDEVKTSIVSQKELLNTFQKEYQNLMNKYFHPMNDQDSMAVFAKLNELEHCIIKIKDQHQNQTPSEAIEQSAAVPAENNPTAVQTGDIENNPSPNAELYSH